MKQTQDPNRDHRIIYATDINSHCILFRETPAIQLRAGGTHPTGMNSYKVQVFSNILYILS